ncbi:sodium:proton antiporter [Candidatus Aerophobetes bacterium]|uniref:Sodium:proton antiporter n=1 Tax=Aerophobetes bacterium TaxID=2030807 RepID=A0A662DBL9_UNCAE|nr:MAG: sodium:proton antiporter [Candidatus Aerophobetes bacterium]
MEESEIVYVISRKLAPYILLFGLYLISFGHLSPGGGFQGGVVLASGVILLCLSRGTTLTQRLFPADRIGLVEVGAFSLFLLIGIAGLVAGRYFLGNFLPLGKAGQVPSAGFIFFLNIIIGLKVGAGIVLVCFYLLREK